MTEITIGEATQAARAAQVAFSTYNDTVVDLNKVVAEARLASYEATRRAAEVRAAHENAEANRTRGIQTAKRLLERASKLVHWMATGDAWEYSEACKDFLAKLPATRSDLFDWAENERDFCGDFQDLYEAAEAAGALEGLILPEPSRQPDDDRTPADDGDQVTTAPTFTTAAQIATSQLLDMAARYGRRAELDELLGEGDWAEVNELANRLPTGDRIRAEELLRRIRGIPALQEGDAPLAPSQTSTQVLVAEARAELLALAQRYGAGNISALLDRHATGDAQATGDLNALANRLPNDVRASAFSWLRLVSNSATATVAPAVVVVTPVGGDAWNALLELANEHGGREGRRRVEDLLGQVVAEARGEV